MDRNRKKNCAEAGKVEKIANMNNVFQTATLENCKWLQNVLVNENNQNASMKQIRFNFIYSLIFPLLCRTHIQLMTGLTLWKRRISFATKTLEMVISQPMSCFFYDAVHINNLQWKVSSRSPSIQWQHKTVQFSHPMPLMNTEAGNQSGASQYGTVYEDVQSDKTSCGSQEHQDLSMKRDKRKKLVRYHWIAQQTPTQPLPFISGWLVHNIIFCSRRIARAS